MQTAEGYTATVLSGEAVSVGGEMTGKLPGRLQRGSQVLAAEPRNGTVQSVGQGAVADQREVLFRQIGERNAVHHQRERGGEQREPG